MYMKKVIFTKAHKSLIERLEKARLESGLSQKQAADLLKRTQSYVSKIESGQRRVDIIQLKEFSKIYNKSLDYFLNDSL